MKTLPELMKAQGYFTFNSGKDDYNFHYDRRQLYDVGTMPTYAVGMNGWQGNRARGRALPQSTHLHETVVGNVSI